MRSSFIPTLIGLVYCLVAAAPFQKRSFKVERKRNVHFRGYNGPKELLKAYQKYNRPLPPALLEALKSHGGKPPTIQSTPSKMRPDFGGGGIGGGRGFGGPSGPGGPMAPGAALPPPIPLTGLVTASPETNDVEYLSPVTIGTQTLNLDFDTGSSDLWVFNTLLPAASTSGHALFDLTASSTFRLLPDTAFSITYGDDSGASGVVGRDAVTVGGVQVPDQAVELATNVSGSFVEDVRSAGILGLAFSTLNAVRPEREKTFFENLMPTLAEPVFTADLRSGGAVGAYEFGRVDPDKFRGEMAWVGVDATEGFWQLETTGFAVGEKRNVTGLVGGSGQAIVDTGTTLMLVARDVSNRYYRQVEGAKDDPKMGGVTFPCEAELPDLFVDVGVCIWPR